MFCYLQDVPFPAEAKHRERHGQDQRAAVPSNHRSESGRDHRRRRDDHRAHAVTVHDAKLGKRRQHSPAARSDSPADRWQMV